MFIRVDDRLIHGQVVQGWLPSLKIKEVIVVKEDIKDFMLKMMRMSLPENYGLKLMSAAQSAEYINGRGGENIFVLVPDMKEALALYDGGLKYGALNIGGIHYKDGSEAVWQGFFLTEEEKEMIKKLTDRGVEIDTRAVPKDKTNDIKRVFT